MKNTHASTRPTSTATVRSNITVSRKVRDQHRPVLDGEVRAGARTRAARPCSRRRTAGCRPARPAERARPAARRPARRSSVGAWTMPATGDVAAGADVGDGARDRAGRRDAAEERRDEIRDALRHQLLVRIVARRVDQVVGHARAQQRLDRAEQRDRRRSGRAGCLHVPSSKSGSAKSAAPAECRRSACRWSRPAARASAAASVSATSATMVPGTCAASAQRAAPSSRVGQRLPRREQLRPQRTGRRGRPHRARSAYGLKLSRCAASACDLREEVGRHLADLQAEQVLQLRQRDQHRDAVGEADDDRHRDVAHQRAELEQPDHEQQHAGQRGRDQQVGQPVALDDAVDDDDEGAGRPADLHPRAAERGDQEAGDDRGEDALLGLDARGDRERHRQRQRDDADRDAGADIGEEAGAVVACHCIEQPRAEARGLDRRRSDQCAAAVAAPMPVSERTCWPRKPARSWAARGLRSRIENSQMPTKPMVIENSAGDA